MLCQLEILGLESTLEEESVEVDSTDKDGKAKSKPKVVDPQKDKRAKNLISMSLSDGVLRKVMKENTALGIWKALERDYQSKARSNRIYLKHKFTSFKMVETKSIEENMDDFLKLVDDLASININIADEDQALQILDALPKQYDQLVDTLKYGSGNDILTLNDVVNSAYSKERDLKEKGLLATSRTDAEGLFVGGDSRGRTSQRSKQQWRERSKSKPRSKGKSESDQSCWICGKEDHWKRDCPERRQGKKPTDFANSAIEFKEPMVLTASVQDTKQDWILDSGCTFHITSNKELLFDFKEFEGEKVLMANNTHSDVKGIGKIQIVNSEGAKVILTKVRYMPTVGRNLISYGALEKAGCHYEGRGFKVQFYKGKEKVISGKYSDGLYYLEGQVIKNETAKAEKRLKKKRVSFSPDLIQGPTGAFTSSVQVRVSSHAGNLVQGGAISETLVQGGAVSDSDGEDRTEDVGETGFSLDVEERSNGSLWKKAQVKELTSQGKRFEGRENLLYGREPLTVKRTLKALHEKEQGSQKRFGCELGCDRSGIKGLVEQRDKLVKRGDSLVEKVSKILPGKRVGDSVVQLRGI